MSISTYTKGFIQGVKRQQLNENSPMASTISKIQNGYGQWYYNDTMRIYDKDFALGMMVGFHTQKKLRTGTIHSPVNYDAQHIQNNYVNNGYMCFDDNYIYIAEASTLFQIDKVTGSFTKLKRNTADPCTSKPFVYAACKLQLIDGIIYYLAQEVYSDMQIFLSYNLSTKDNMVLAGVPHYNVETGETKSGVNVDNLQLYNSETFFARIGADTELLSLNGSVIQTLSGVRLYQGPLVVDNSVYGVVSIMRSDVASEIIYSYELRAYNILTGTEQILYRLPSDYHSDTPLGFYDGYIYYVHYYRLYRIISDGTAAPEVVTHIKIRTYNIVGNILYFVAYDSSLISWMNLEDGQVHTFQVSAEHLYIDNNSIYFTLENKVGKCDPTTMKFTRLTPSAKDTFVAVSTSLTTVSLADNGLLPGRVTFNDNRNNNNISKDLAIWYFYDDGTPVNSEELRRVPGTYTLNIKIVDIDYIDQAFSKQVTITVPDSGGTPVDVDNVEVTLKQGEKVTLAPLQSTIQVTMQDGTKASVPVTWGYNDSRDENALGTFYYEGIIYNTYKPNRPFYLIVHTVKTLKYAIGTYQRVQLNEAYDLPIHATLLFTDGSTDDFSVTWTGSYNTAVVGRYIVHGNVSSYNYTFDMLIEVTSS